MSEFFSHEQHFLDINWTSHSRLTSTRVYSFGAVVKSNLYMLGSHVSSAWGTTEKLDNISSGIWTKSFHLKSKVTWGCAVQISEFEIITISGKHSSTKAMHLYNLLAGNVTKYNVIPPIGVVIFFFSKLPVKYYSNF